MCVLLILTLTENALGYRQSTDAYCSMDCRCMGYSIFCFKLPPSSIIFNSVKTEKTVLYIERDDDVRLFLSNKELFFTLFNTVYLPDGKQYNAPSLNFKKTTSSSIVLTTTEIITSSERQVGLISYSPVTSASPASTEIENVLISDPERTTAGLTSSSDVMIASTYFESQYETIKHASNELMDRYHTTDRAIRIGSDDSDIDYSDYGFDTFTHDDRKKDKHDSVYSMLDQSMYKLLFYLVSSVLLCLLVVLISSILIRKLIKRNRFERLILDESRHDLELQEIGCDARADDTEL